MPRQGKLVSARPGRTGVGWARATPAVVRVLPGAAAGCGSHEERVVEWGTVPRLVMGSGVAGEPALGGRGDGERRSAHAVLGGGRMCHRADFGAEGVAVGGALCVVGVLRRISRERFAALLAGAGSPVPPGRESRPNPYEVVFVLPSARDIALSCSNHLYTEAVGRSVHSTATAHPYSHRPGTAAPYTETSGKA